MENKQVLAEIDSILAERPDLSDFNPYGGPGSVWLGKVNAVLPDQLRIGERGEVAELTRTIEQDKGAHYERRRPALNGLLRLLHKVRYQLLMDAGGSGVVAVDKGMHFEYFNFLKEIVQGAVADVFIVDPYLSDEVLSRFCVFAKEGVTIRLLGWRNIPTLQPAAQALKLQRGLVSLRKSEELHDRYFFIDRTRCVMSGASFKDGPKYAPSMLTEVVDGAKLLLDMYEARWNVATDLLQ
jgi:hypothetical protein